LFGVHCRNHRRHDADEINHTKNTIMTILFAIIVLLFALACSVKAITAQRAKHADFLAAFDARHAARGEQLESLLAMIEDDKKNGLI
jgi:hypothetical protein